MISLGRLSSSDLVFDTDLKCVCEVADIKPVREEVISVILPLSNASQKKIWECMFKKTNKIFDCLTTRPFFCFYILEQPRIADE